MKYIILFIPAATREYSFPEAVGPFDSEAEAQEHLEQNLTVEEGWEVEVIPLQNQNAEAE